MKYGVEKIVHISSSAVYEINQKNPLTEESKINPVGVYGKSKYCGEKVCYEYQKKGLDITIVRPRAVIGAGRLGIYQILFDWIKRGKKIYIIGSGENRIQFVHVNDLAEAMLLMSQKAGSEIFNIGTEKFDTLKNDLQGLIDYANTGSKIVSINPAIAMNLLKILDKFNLSPLADWHYLSYHKDFYFDINKAKTILGWQPTYGNQDMLIESYKWYIENFKNVELQFGTTHRKSVRQKLLKILRDLS